MSKVNARFLRSRSQETVLSPVPGALVHCLGEEEDVDDDLFDDLVPPVPLQGLMEGILKCTNRR